MLKLNHLTGFGSGAAGAAADVTSYVFDGTGDYLSVADSADWDILSSSSGDWTISLFARFSSTPTGSQTLISQEEGNTDRWSFYHNTTNAITLAMKTGNTNVLACNGGTPIADLDWHHIALCKVDDEYGTYIDGTQQAYLQDSSVDTMAAALNIGGGSVNNDFPGYMDEILIEQSNVFNAAPNATPDDTIVVPTAQHTPNANTKLLIHGGEAYTGPLTGETTAPCYVLDGTADCELTIPDHADFDFPNGGDFTFEFFIRVPAIGGAEDWIYSQTEDDDNEITLRILSSGAFVWKVEESASVIVTITSNAAVTANTWHHVAVVRSTDTYYIWIDGVDQTASGSPDSTTPATSTANIRIGSRISTGGWFTGYLNEYRISDTARYTTGFTPTTTQFVSDANTKLLIHGDEYFTGNRLSGTTGSGATFTDSGNTGHTVTEVGNAISARGGTFTDSGNTGHAVSEVGNAQRDTTTYKF